MQHFISVLYLLCSGAKLEASRAMLQTFCIVVMKLLIQNVFLKPIYRIIGTH